MSDRIEWTGDLDDDCTAHWRGLVLRAEKMSRRSWWWAVYDEAAGIEVHNYDAGQLRRCKSGKAARAAAEGAAVALVVIATMRSKP